MSPIKMVLRTARLLMAVPWTALFSVVVIVMPRLARGAADIGDIIKNVRANEQLYKDLDVIIQDEYVDSQASLGWQKDFLPIRQKTIDIRYVKQEGMFHLDIQGTVRRETSERKEETVARNKIRLFDGSTSRDLQGNKANIVAGATLDADMISPHMLILQPCGYPVPLSTYMEGHQAMLACRDLKWNPRIHIQIESQGEEVVETHPCQKVAIKHVSAASGRLQIAWVLWLALDRNYLPIRCEAYTYRVSKTVPVGRAVARNLREIAPGVWFPYEVVYTAYNSITLREHQRQELAWRERYTVKSVSLEPHYPIAFFRDLRISDGTYVYEVNANGKIGRSYVQGAPSESVAHGTSSRWWLVWGSVLALIACSITLIVRRRMKLSR
jgi:hypothetical protein